MPRLDYPPPQEVYPLSRKIPAIAILLLLCAAPSLGWGPEGHRITGRIASRYLTDAARREVRALLGDQTLADVTTWADEIGDDPRYERARPMHYVNVPREAAAFDLSRDCSDRACVVAAIEDCTVILRNREAHRSDRIEALKFLVHFVGDVHQPLHVSYEDDRGGNELEIDFFGTSTNLHRLWDTDMIRHAMPGDWPRHAERIGGTITPELATQWTERTTAEQWANESLAITRAHVYPGGPVITAAYVEVSVPIIEERLAMAGVRMADLLNRIFDPAAESPDAPKDDPAPAGPIAFVSVVLEDPCGDADGRRAFLVNRHEARIIRVRVKQTRFTGEERSSSEHDWTIRPGDHNRRSLGCTARRLRGEVVREITWEVIDAEWR